MLVVLGVVTFSMWLACGGSFSLVILLSDICHDPDAIARNFTNDPSTRGDLLTFYGQVYRYLCIML